MKKNYKKRFKEKIKVTLKILVLFVIVKNIGLGYDPNLNNVDSDVEVIEKKDEEIQLNDIDHEGYGKAKGLYIKNSENLTVNIEKINVTLKKNDRVPGIVSANGLENVSTKSGNDGDGKVTISDGLKINVTAKEDLGIKVTQLVGVTNTRELTLGKNTKINVVMEGEVASISTAYGMELKSNSVTHLGEGSEINVSNSTGIATGISIDSTGFLGDESNVFIGDNVKIRAEVRDAKSEIKNGHWALGIYQMLGDTVTIGNGLILETEINLSNGVLGQSYAVYNMANGKINIGKNAIISTKGTNASQVCGIYNEGSSSKATIGDGGTITAIGENTVFVMGLSNNKGGEMNIGNGVKISSILNSESQKNYAYSVYNKGDSILNIGKNSEISVEGRDANQIRAVHNEGSSSKATIGDGGTITAIGENTVFVMGLSNINSGKMNIGNEVKISSILNSKSQKNTAYSVYNKGKSTLNIGKNSEISVEGRDANQIRALHNDGTSSKITIEDGSIITASGENNSVVIGVSNKTGSIKLDGGTDIYSEGYAVYNDSGNVSITDKGYSKKIQGLIFSTKAGAVTDILLDTNDSYLEGASSKYDEGVFNFGLKNNAVWYVPQNSAVTNFDIENGIVDMTQNYKGETISGKQKLSIDKTSGSGGTYIMDISPEDRDQTGDKTDGINIEKADVAQKNYIQVGKTSIVGLVKYNFSDIENSSIMIASADKNVTFEGTKFTDTASIYDYVLSLEENIKGEAGKKNIWYVTGVEKQEGEVIKNIETAITLNYMSAVSSRSELSSVHKRLGEIHNGTSENGTWAGTSSGQMEHNKSSEKFKNEYNTLQIGYDKRKETEKRSIFTGFAVHKKEGKTDFKNGDGKNYDIGISLYKSFVMEDNSYANLVVKYSYINNEHKNYTSDMQEMKTDYNTWSGSISFEYGKKYTKNNWYMIPQMQMDYTFVKGADYTMNSGIKVEQENINSLVGRTRMYAGYDFEKSSHFIKTGILQEFSGDYGARITGIDTTVNKKYKGKDTWLEAGIGGYFEVGKTGTTNIYYNIEKTFGSKFERNWQVSLGLRIKF